MERQFTATVYVLHDGKALLVYHKKLEKWLPPGGHMESNELPTEAAKREVREETGLEIAFVTQENVWVERWNATSFERPFMCLLEEIPAYKDKPAHQHIDFIYLGRPVGGNPENAEPGTEQRWFTLDEIDALESEVEIFEETRQVLRVILTDALVL